MQQVPHLTDIIVELQKYRNSLDSIMNGSKKTKHFLALSIIVTLSIIFPSQNLEANPYKKARRAFKKGDYTESKSILRPYVLRNRGDYRSWALLGATNFHLGNPRTSIKIMRKIFHKSSEKSYNLYYQGLSYNLTDQTRKAKKHLLVASKYSDEYGARSTFELAIIEYHKRNIRQSQYWASQYLKRFPRGRFKKRVQILLDSLASGKYIRNLKGADYPDKEQARVDNSYLSLIKGVPNFYFFTMGFNGGLNRTYDPTNDGRIKPTVTQRYRLLGSAGVGLGPLVSEKSTLHLAYRYTQYWHSDQTRFQSYIDDPGDLGYFPFQPDSLEREHAMLAMVEYQPSKTLSAGLNASFDIKLIGSEYLNTSDVEGIDQVLPISDGLQLIPWMAIKWNFIHKTTAYTDFTKIMNRESSDLSRRNYNIANDEPSISGGILHQIYLSNLFLKIEGEVYRQDIIFNDYWLDVLQVGGRVNISHELISNTFITLSGEYATHAYERPLISLRPCDRYSTENRTITKCYRDDTVTTFQMSLLWQITPLNSVRLTGSMFETYNEYINIFNKKMEEVTIELNMSFPSHKRTAPMRKQFSTIQKPGKELK